MSNTSSARTIKIGTRGSKLALFQAHMVRDALCKSHNELGIEICVIETSGEWKPSQGETRLSEAEGGKGQFAKEIEESLFSGAVDIGVHSMKDMESFLPEGLVLNHILKREDPRDAFLSNNYRTIEELPEGAVVGTSSLRRQAFILARRPDLKIVPFRGNVPTRIEKLRSGQVDATILAVAGLKRLGLMHEAASEIPVQEMLPSAGQGAVGIEIKEADTELAQILAPLHCRETGLRVQAERAALQALHGGCHTPVGAYAVLKGDQMHLKVIVAEADGSQMYEDETTKTVETEEQARALGQIIGERLKERIPPHILEH